MSEHANPLAGRQLGSADTTFVVVEWTDQGESDADHPIAPLHIHHGGEEAWYVVEGTLGVRLEHATIEVGAGSAVLARRGTPHTFWNAGDGPCRYVVIMTPEIANLIDAMHSPSARSDRASLNALFAQYRSELL